MIDKEEENRKVKKRGFMKITIIGVGNMGTILARYLSQEHTVVLCDHHLEKGEAIAAEIGGSFFLDPTEAISGADLIIFAIKPKDLGGLARVLLGKISSSQSLISILAGVEISKFKEWFPDSTIVRMMPNLAISIGNGLIAFSSPQISVEQKKHLDFLFAKMGKVFWIPENKMNSFASLAASSPAFIFVLIEAMIEAGIGLGFSALEAREIVLGVVSGATSLLDQTGKTPGELKWQVTSPGGTTIKGIKELEANSFRIAIWKAIEASS